ncbi:RHS repeat-associated core domain-containing protein [Burkholderia contaminans]|uniref:RHS repeat-associated core domain-containing protein n=1 Tax=Burkholderia contaminans TaxID=488447 RepID=UPI00158CB3F4|nr:RHS repeat-associated core domain-containing protein [Burkholderia contaminans]
MALLAVKHLDPVVGVDVHSVLVTPGTPPVFLPHPHVGFMLDLREYIQAAKAVVGCIAMMIVQEKVTEYIEDHQEDVTKLEHLADEASQQFNELIGGGNLPDLKDDPTVAEGMKLAKAANRIKNRISDDLGSNVGAGGGSGRPIFVNGMMRATAGTHAYHVPGLHFPLGESFAPPPAEFEPSNDGESFMGSKTVLANNDPMSYMALEALSCWSVGMEPPGHNSAHTDRSYPSMPSSVMLPIPAGRPVMVGGPPVMNMAATAKGLFKAFQGSKWARALADKLRLKPGFLRCNVLKAEPVDVTTGEVVVNDTDFTVSGRLSFVWDRRYESHNKHIGAVGAGWLTPADVELEPIRHEQGTGAVVRFPDHSAAFDAIPAEDGWTSRTYDAQYGHALYTRDRQIVLHMRSGIEYEFPGRRWPHGANELHDEADAAQRIRRIADPNGNAWVFERESDGTLTRIVEWTRIAPTQRVIECHSEWHGQAKLLISLTLIDAAGRVHPLVNYEHDHDQNLTAAIDPMAYRHQFEYSNDHRMVAHTNPRGVAFYYSYMQDGDGIWRVDHAWGDNGLFDYRFAYDRTKMETRWTDSLGHRSIIQMNERGMPISEIDPLDGTTSYRYDSQGRTNAELDPAGRTSAWEYDTYGNILVHTLPDGTTTRCEYDTEHRLVRRTKPGERTWHFEWDNAGNLTAMKTPSQAMSRYRYDRYGQLVSYTRPNGATAQFTYDPNGHLETLIDERGYRTNFTHDVRGRLARIVNALGETSSYEYDRKGNLTRAVESGGGEVHCDYDADNNLVRYRDPLGHVSRIEYSALGHISKRTMPDGGVVEYRYDTEERLTGLLNESGALYSLKRDALGRIVEEIDYWGQSRRYIYNSAGLLERSIDPLNREIEYRSDLLGRIVQKRIPDPRQPDGNRIEAFTYDPNGNLVCATTPDSVVQLRYDVDGQVVEEKQGDDFLIANTYDSSGNRIERRTEWSTCGEKITYVVRFQYDALDEVMSIKINDAEPITLERDAIGQIRVEQFGHEQRRELTYGPDGLLAKQALLSGTGVVFTSEYAYDANGDLIEKRDSRTGIERFEYDPVGRLTSHTDPTGKLLRFLYDPGGDLLKTHMNRSDSAMSRFARLGDTWTRIAQYGDCRYTFDCVGNLTHKHGDEDLRLSWDADGLLIETETRRQTETGQSCIRTKYTYDAFHRRVGKSSRTSTGDNVDVAPSTGESMHSDSRFFWDGDAIAREHTIKQRAVLKPGAIDDQFRIGREWVYYPESFHALAVLQDSPIKGNRSTDDASPERNHLRQADQGIHFFHSDPNGAPIRTTDIFGNIVWEQRYDGWGEVDRRSTHEQPLRYQGQYSDTETGLHYNRHRYYDPQIGSFISQDPLGLEGGVNVYQYAPNPLAWIDPFGLAKKPPSTFARRDGTGASAADMAASKVGGGSRSGQEKARNDLLAANPSGVYTCWRCGQTSTNPADMHLGHKNVPTSKGGNLANVNVALEGASCNLSAGSSGYVKAGMSCVERGSCGAPYGR